MWHVSYSYWLDQNEETVIKNYLVTIFRQINKNKVFSFINILGLSLGMMACLVISQYVNFHTSFDKFHTNADRIFRVEGSTTKNGNELGNTINAPSPLGSTLKSGSPIVNEVARFFDYNYANNTIIYNQESGNQVNFDQGKVYVTESGLFNIFDLDFRAGNASKFEEPQKAILTLGASKKYFDDPQKAIGSSFTLSGNTGSHEYELVGILEDLPENSHLDFELLLSYPSLDLYTESRNNWGSNSVNTYLLLDNPETESQVVDQIKKLYDENSKELFAQSGYTVDYTIKPLEGIHLNSKNAWSFKPGIDRQMIYIMALIAIVILVIAWINYINLSMIRTVDRLKEIGIRKCMGSSMKQITLLFVMEALVMNLIAFSVAILLTQFSETYLISITNLPVSALLDSSVILLLSALIVAGTLLIGFFPYGLLKTLNMVNILIGKKGRLGGSSLRKSLVFAQFVITFILIAGTLTVYNQVNYMREADLGIDIENVLVIKSPPGDVSSEKREDVSRFSTLKTELLKQTSISEISNAGEIPGQEVSWGANLYLKNSDKESSIRTGLISMDLDFPAFFDIDLLAGRELRRGDSPWGKGDCLINEKLALELGFSTPEEAIGAQLEGFYGPVPLVVRGVLENHHHTSLHDDYQSYAYILSSWTEFYFVKLKTDPSSSIPPRKQLATALDVVESEWNNIFVNFQMDYFFLDKAFDEQYKEDVRFGKIFSGFSTLAILIACLGLFGLTSFTIQQRTKEIGIRKVLGANAKNLVLLLSREYILLVSIACLISIPIAWWVMSQWLDDYSFRITLGWWFYLIPVIFVIGMALLSVMFKIMSTVKTNPIRALRYE